MYSAYICVLVCVCKFSLSLKAISENYDANSSYYLSPYHLSDTENSASVTAGLRKLLMIFKPNSPFVIVEKEFFVILQGCAGKGDNVCKKQCVNGKGPSSP